MWLVSCWYSCCCWGPSALSGYSLDAFSWLPPFVFTCPQELTHLCFANPMFRLLALSLSLSLSFSQSLPALPFQAAPAICPSSNIFQWWRPPKPLNYGHTVGSSWEPLPSGLRQGMRCRFLFCAALQVSASCAATGAFLTWRWGDQNGRKVKPLSIPTVPSQWIFFLSLIQRWSGWWKWVVQVSFGEPCGND